MEQSRDDFRASGPEAGSFRDPDGRVFYHEGEVYRGLSQRALADFSTLSATRLFRNAIAEQRLVDTHRVDADLLPLGGWAAVLKHERIPFTSYPYEWTFGMLKDAALLQLQFMREGLDEGLMLKDATPYNVQWRGTRPVFIDIPSFVPLEGNEPWLFWRQFCQLYLYPLMLQAYRNVPFQPWLRANLDGIEARHAANLFSLRDWLRAGVLSHVVLPARLQQGLADVNTVGEGMRKAGLDVSVLRANIVRLEKLVTRLVSTAGRSGWTDYAQDNSYGAEAAEAKKRFVSDCLASRSWTQVWDVGCNTGTFSRMAAEHAEQVIAMDGDAECIERLYQSSRLTDEKRNERILPLIMDLSNPSPSQGWRGLERKSLGARAQADLVLCLALVHHLILSSNIDMQDCIDWLGGLAPNLIVEFPTATDPMVKRLLARRSAPVVWTVERFESCLQAVFEVEKREELPGGDRIIYFARRRH